MSEELSIALAKARFAEAVRRAERGEVLILTRHGRPVARLGPLEAGRSDVLLEQVGSAEVREAPDSYQRADAEPPVASSVGRMAQRRAALERVLAGSVWPRVPEDQLGRAPDRREREEILGHREDEP